VRRLASLGSVIYGSVLVEPAELVRGQAEVDADAWLHVLRWAVRRYEDDRRFASSRPSVPLVDAAFALGWAVVGARTGLARAVEAGASQDGSWHREAASEIDRSAAHHTRAHVTLLDFATGWWSVPRLYRELTRDRRVRVTSIRALRCLLETNTVWRLPRRLVGSGATVHDDADADGGTTVVFEQVDLVLWYGSRFGDAATRVRCDKARLLFGTERRWDVIERVAAGHEATHAKSAALLRECRNRGLDAMRG
jgi:hypothetical protein